MHIGYDQLSAYNNLVSADTTLRQNKLGQPLIVGETAYNDLGVATGIKTFRTTYSSRKLDEVMQWPKSAVSTCGMSETPPYSVTAYAATLH